MASATITDGEAPFTYTLFQNSTQMTSFSGLAAGMYKVLVKDVHGCYSDSVTIDINEPDTLHVINCPTAAATYQVLPGETFVTVELDDPTFAPDLNNARVTERQGKADNNLYSVGTYTITYIIRNDCNEEETCSVTFTVESGDDTAPCIGCDSTAVDPTDPTSGVSCTSIGAQSVQPNNGATYVHADNSWNVTATDNDVEVTLTYKLFGATTAVTTPNTTLNGQVFNEGETTVRWIAEDAVGNADSCEFTVTVEVIELMSGTLTVDSVICYGANDGAAVIAITGGKSGSPRYTYTVTGVNMGYTNNSTTDDNISLTDLTPDHYTVHIEDLMSNTLDTAFNITVRPSVLTPGNVEFTCPDTTVTLKYGMCDTLLELNHTLINNMSSMTVTLDSIGVPVTHRYNVENSPYTITWKVMDECGAYVEYQQMVTVNYPPCGNDHWVTDGDGISYPTVQVGCNCWTARNARSTLYTDGTPITPAPMQYPGTEQHPEDTIYGKLYTYNAATRVPLTRAIPTQVQGICPDGWHIPDDEDFADLMAHWEGEELNAIEHWLTPGTNLSGFTMEPGGRYNAEHERYEYLLVRGYLWSYTPGATTIVHACEFGSACGTVEIIPATMPTGFSVRCVHNAE